MIQGKPQVSLLSGTYLHLFFVQHQPLPKKMSNFHRSPLKVPIYDHLWSPHAWSNHPLKRPYYFSYSNFADSSLNWAPWLAEQPVRTWSAPGRTKKTQPTRPQPYRILARIHVTPTLIPSHTNLKFEGLEVKCSHKIHWIVGIFWPVSLYFHGWVLIGSM